MSTANKTNVNENEYSDILTIIGRMFLLMKRHFLKVLAIVIVFIIMALSYLLLTYSPSYKSSVTFTITPLVLSDSESGISVYKFNSVTSFSDQMNKTFQHIAQSEALRDTITYDLGRPMNGRIVAEPITGSNIFKVTAISSSAKDANDIMESFVKSYPSIAEHIIGDTRIQIIHSSGKPQKPYNVPNYFLYGFIGLLVGICINLLIFYVIANYAQTIKDKTDITTKLNSHYICTIPHVYIKRNSNDNVSLIKMSPKLPDFSEAVRVLKKRVSALLRENEKIVAITGTTLGEGSTTISYNLAHAMANGNQRTLLVDMDMVSRTLQNVLLKDPKKCIGISDVVSKNADLDKVICNISENFDVLFAGLSDCKYTNSGFKRVFKELRDNYDIIIVDMPPTGVLPSVSLVTELCDNIIFNVKSDDTGISRIKRALQYILYSKARLIGFVINNHNTGSSYGYGGYTGRYRSGYGYRSKYRYLSRYRYGKYRGYGGYGYGGYGIDSIEPKKK
ncbi:MAG: AAA family ATPase [Clostridia bacterium]|nr:AAA family ATPase [Clostridia bacterium]